MTGSKRRIDAHRRARFVQEYAKDLNATQAAVRAGYSRKTANRQGSRLLKNADIAAQVRELLERASQSNEVTVERVLREIGRVAFSDIRKLFAADGTLRPLDELDDDTAALISSVEVDEITAGTGADRVVIGHTRKVKLWDKGRALEQCMGYLGMHKTKGPTEGGEWHLTINLSKPKETDRD